MSWGRNVEVYLMKKDPADPENRVAGERTLAHFRVGEEWTPIEVEAVINKMENFLKALKKAKKEIGIKNLVIRSNI